MKKKIMAILMTVVMGLTLCGMSPVSAEEAVGTILYGDVNLDSKVSVLDVITISKYNAEIITLNEDQLLAADCDADGVVNLNDVDSLMNRMVENITELPAEVKARERDYFESHTFEEFLALSEEEIGAISETAAIAYSDGILYHEMNLRMTEINGMSSSPFIPMVNVVTYENYAVQIEDESGDVGSRIDDERLYSDLKLSADFLIARSDFLTTNNYFDVHLGVYNNYDSVDVMGKLMAWLALNPNIEHFGMEMLGA